MTIICARIEICSTLTNPMMVNLLSYEILLLQKRDSDGFFGRSVGEVKGKFLRLQKCGERNPMESSAGGISTCLKKHIHIYFERHLNAYNACFETEEIFDFFGCLKLKRVANALK